MNVIDVRQIVAVSMVLAWQVLAEPQSPDIEAMALSSKIYTGGTWQPPIPTNEVTILAVRTQVVQGVQTELKMLAQPAQRIQGGGVGNYLAFCRLIECQAISTANTSNPLVYGWFLRFYTTSRQNEASEWYPEKLITGNLALTQDGKQMFVVYHDLDFRSGRQMWMQWYSVAEATTNRPQFPDKWSHSSTNEPCGIEGEIKHAFGGVLAAEIIEATESKVLVWAEGRYTNGKKRHLEFYPQERRWVLLPEEKAVSGSAPTPNSKQ